MKEFDLREGPPAQSSGSPRGLMIPLSPAMISAKPAFRFVNTPIGITAFVIELRAALRGGRAVFQNVEKLTTYVGWITIPIARFGSQSACW
jgi:hypothetical protein